MKEVFEEILDGDDYDISSYIKEIDENLIDSSAVAYPDLS